MGSGIKRIISDINSFMTFRVIPLSTVYSIPVPNLPVVSMPIAVPTVPEQFVSADPTMKEIRLFSAP